MYKFNASTENIIDLIFLLKIYIHLYLLALFWLSLGGDYYYVHNSYIYISKIVFVSLYSFDSIRISWNYYQKIFISFSVKYWFWYGSVAVTPVSKSSFKLLFKTRKWPSKSLKESLLIHKKNLDRSTFQIQTDSPRKFLSLNRPRKRNAREIQRGWIEATKGAKDGMTKGWNYRELAGLCHETVQLYSAWKRPRNSPFIPENPFLSF